MPSQCKEKSEVKLCKVRSNETLQGESGKWLLVHVADEDDSSRALCGKEGPWEDPPNPRIDNLAIGCPTCRTETAHWVVGLWTRR